MTLTPKVIVNGGYKRFLIRYAKGIVNLGLMGGLLLLINTGAGAVSIDSE
ncbi:hypothetical protein FRE64_08470 [Euhalothece natronophila Z-M001]|uniref:Uncharacterized protein n=1 Tax=Euhalothece natronophila Z-M001 TaxID=522448 RepID=A0A5B8NR16_9CHRO|nr:hypothetical protein FRE64_08470 [Euhalothece natronophila Z-M001]